MADLCFAKIGAAADELHARCAGGVGWYVGVAADPGRRLDVLHNVDLETGRFAIVKCANAGVALGAARLLRDERGYRGATGSGGPDSVYLYAYAITPETREPE